MPRRQQRRNLPKPFTNPKARRDVWSLQLSWAYSRKRACAFDQPRIPLVLAAVRGAFGPCRGRFAAAQRPQSGRAAASKLPPKPNYFLHPKSAHHPPPLNKPAVHSPSATPRVGWCPDRGQCPPEFYSANMPTCLGHGDLPQSQALSASWICRTLLWYSPALRSASMTRATRASLVSCDKDSESLAVSSAVSVLCAP